MSAGDADLAEVLHDALVGRACLTTACRHRPMVDHLAAALAPVIEARVAAAVAGACEVRIRRLNPPEGADLPTWHALHQTVLTIVGGATLAATDATEGEGL